MKSGTVSLKTKGGERKMHYIEIDNAIYMSTPSDSNKVKQINEDNKVYIKDCCYTATILDDDENIKKYNDLLKNNMPSIMKFITKFKNTSKNIILKLEQN